MITFLLQSLGIFDKIVQKYFEGLWERIDKKRNSKRSNLLSTGSSYLIVFVFQQSNNLGTGFLLFLLVAHYIYKSMFLLKD